MEIAKSAYVHSARVLQSSDTRSPGSMPRSMRPRPISETISPTSRKVTSRHSPLSLSLYLTATLSAYFSAAFGSRSAIVCDPVDSIVDGAVVASISLLFLSSGGPSPWVRILGEKERLAGRPGRWG